MLIQYFSEFRFHLPRIWQLGLIDCHLYVPSFVDEVIETAAQFPAPKVSRFALRSFVNA